MRCRDTPVESWDKTFLQGESKINCVHIRHANDMQDVCQNPTRENLLAFLTMHPFILPVRGSALIMCTLHM